MQNTHCLLGLVVTVIRRRNWKPNICLHSLLLSTLASVQFRLHFNDFSLIMIWGLNIGSCSLNLGLLNARGSVCCILFYFCRFSKTFLQPFLFTLSKKVKAERKSECLMNWERPSWCGRGLFTASPSISSIPPPWPPLPTGLSNCSEVPTS